VSEINAVWAIVTDVATDDPVSLDTVKQHLRISHDDEDSLLESYRTAARKHIELISGVRIGLQTWDYRQSAMSMEWWLPGAPLVSITSIKNYDADGVEQTVDTASYRADTMSRPGRVEWVSGIAYPALQSGRMYPLTTRYVCGYTEATLPRPVAQALLLLTGHFYENREGGASSAVKDAVDALCAPYKALWRPAKC
jgi:uncharacterized phiE125 gp8 family phage protein